MKAQGIQRKAGSGKASKTELFSKSLFLRSNHPKSRVNWHKMPYFFRVSVYQKSNGWIFMRFL
jgi:hypothetical protein